MPFFKGQQRFTGHAFGGWELSGVTYLNTERHYTERTNEDPRGLSKFGPTYSGSRPDLFGDPEAGAPHTLGQWFNKNAFAQVPAGQIRSGKEPRGTILGPSYARWDAFYYSRTHELRSALACNFAPKLSMCLITPISGIGSPGLAFRSARLGSSFFDKIQNAYEGRKMRLALKLIF